VRPELLSGLLVGGGDVAGRVDADRSRWSPEVFQRLAEERREGSEAGGRPADHGHHEREAVPRRPDDRFGTAKEVDADLLGEDALLDDVSDGLGMGERAAVAVGGDVAEGVEPEEEGKGGCHIT
jgi:hypothetical protein